MIVNFRQSSGEAYIRLTKTERGWLTKCQRLCTQMEVIGCDESPIAGAAAEGLRALIAKLPKQERGDG